MFEFLDRNYVGTDEIYFKGIVTPSHFILAALALSNVKIQKSPLTIHFNQ